MGCTQGKPQSPEQMTKKRTFCSQATHVSTSKSTSIDMNAQNLENRRYSDFFESADMCLEVVRAIKQRKREQFDEYKLKSKLSIN